MSWQRAQSVAFVVLVVAGVLGLGASTGFTVIPTGPPALAWPLHPLLTVLGMGAGTACIGRSREIDRERWKLLEDDTLTRGERQLAQREAEHEIKVAGSIFLLASLALGAFAAYQLRVDAITVADFLVVSPVAGFLIGLAAGTRIFPPPRRP